MIALIDYGAGNVRSVHKALTAVGAGVTVTRDPAVVLAAEKVVLPGVGAFGDCMASLQRLGLVEPVREIVARGVPFLGICVGMQVLFAEGEEMGCHAGLGLLPGRVVRFDLPAGLKVPHTGWNQIQAVAPGPLFHGLPDGAWTYFNHAYYCRARPEHVLAVTEYGGPFACVVGRGNVCGIQFHPEKSQRVGLHILRNWVMRDA
jgi:glutamine amidotransferase